jgi:hypothetical protein
LLALKQVITGEEPEAVTFEVPIKYDALTHLETLQLCIDRYEPDEAGCWEAGQGDCVRAPNGDCRLVWRTIYETPGQHALVAAFNEPQLPPEEFVGPVTPFVVTNLCQFAPDRDAALADPAPRTKFYGRLPESNGVYRIELKAPNGDVLKTIAGSTSNGFFTVRWDLIDDRGRRCTNESFYSVFYLTLLDSGRSQTLKGP